MASPLRSLLLAAAVLAAAPLPSAEVRTGAGYRGRPAILLANDQIELTVLELGGPLAHIVLNDDPEKLSPMWDSLRYDRESGRPERGSGAVGHFVCVDGFGPVSEQEAAAGLNGHGEAHRLLWTTVAAKNEGPKATLTQSVYLPRVHETLTRTLRIVQGENVIYSHSTLESLLSFDRPACWAEHATIGSPFLEPGVTVVDMSPNRAITRPRPKPRADRRHRLQPGQEFTWPMAPTQGGGKVDLRAAPENPDSLDHTGHRMDSSREFAWVTALHPDKRLLLGYVFRRSDYPWLQTWEHYPPQGMMARGLEFGSQAFDLPRRQVITENRLFGELLYRWLPAKSKIEGRYLLFWTRTPAGFQGVDELELRGGEIRLEDRRSGQRLRLKASLGL